MVLELSTLYLNGRNADHAFGQRFETQDVLYDLAWSEIHENQIVVATGDGSVKLFDISVDQFPVQSWAEHSREVFAVHWNLVGKNTFLSSSWDGCIKIYDPDRDQSITTLPTHSCTYSAQFSPHDSAVVSAVSSDSQLRLFDLRSKPGPNNHLALTTAIHVPPKAQPGIAPPQGLPPAEALTHDWNKYRNTIIATAGVDRLIRTFDIRNAAAGPIAILPGHEYAVRRLSWSPHLSDILLSASYDMTCRVWTDGTALGSMTNQIPDSMAFGGGRQMGRMDRHTEFVMGVDWCLFGAEGWCASTAWDERVLVWDVRTIMGP